MYFIYLAFGLSRVVYMKIDIVRTLGKAFNGWVRTLSLVGLLLLAGELGFEPRIFAFRARCPAVRRLPIVAGRRILPPVRPLRIFYGAQLKSRIKYNGGTKSNQKS